MGLHVLQGQSSTDQCKHSLAVIISLLVELMLSASVSGGFDLSFCAVEGSSDCCFPFIIFLIIANGAASAGCRRCVFTRFGENDESITSKGI